MRVEDIVHHSAILTSEPSSNVLAETTPQRTKMLVIAKEHVR